MKRYLLGIVATVLTGGGFIFAESPPAGAPKPASTSLPGPSLENAGDDDETGSQQKDSTPPQQVLEQTPRPVSDPVSVAPEAFNEQRPCNRLWASAEYLLWWFKRSPEPVPLATLVPPPTRAVPGSPPIGAIGGPGTSVVLGGDGIGTSTRSGGRFTAGFWFDPDQTWGLEGSFFFIGTRHASKGVASDGRDGPLAPNLFVPFANATVAPGTNPEGSIWLGGDIFNGSGTARLSLSSSLYGADLNGIRTLASGCNWRLGVLGGFRYLNLHENLQFTTSTTIPDFPNPAQPSVRSTLDQFNTRNNFYGGQLGLKGEFRWGRLFLDAGAKVALGDVHEIVDISGATAANFIQSAGNLGGIGIGSSPETRAGLIGPGGIFTQPSNIGRYSRDRFGVVPEVDFKVGYEFTRWLRGFVGYSFLYVNNVARPGEQIDHTVNVTQSVGFQHNFTTLPPPPPALVGPARPAFTFNDSSFWAQGITFGLEFRY